VIKPLIQQHNFLYPQNAAVVGYLPRMYKDRCEDSASRPDEVPLMARRDTATAPGNRSRFML
jgi:hypothetical protein